MIPGQRWTSVYLAIIAFLTTALRKYRSKITAGIPQPPNSYYQNRPTTFGGPQSRPNMGLLGRW